MKTGIFLLLLTGAVLSNASAGAEEDATPRFDAETDLLSLHYDHAPDKDDGHSAAADRTILQTMFDRAWIKRHVVAVSGAYGTNAKRFNPDSDRVMDAVWSKLGGWIAAHERHEEAAKKLAERWLETLKAGGSVWIKEGGQSDLTADVVRLIRDKHGDIDIAERVIVVQHSDWNENKTTEEDLAYVKKRTRYIRIKDANRFLNKKGGDRAFEKAAVSHEVFGKSWREAFEYYKPSHRLDFSDTGELMHILGLGEVGIDAFRERFLEAKE